MADAHIRAGTDVGWRDPIVQALERIRGELVSNSAGTVADYIPQLSVADPGWFGLALASLEGHVYRAGDADVAFTIQSISKPFVLALAVARSRRRGGGRTGRGGTQRRGIQRHQPRARHRPAGESDGQRRRDRHLFADRRRRARRALRADPRPHLSAFAGRELEVDEAVFESERATGDRNRALGYLMRNAGSLQR